MDKLCIFRCLKYLGKFFLRYVVHSSSPFHLLGVTAIVMAPAAALRLLPSLPLWSQQKVLVLSYDGGGAKNPMCLRYALSDRCFSLLSSSPVLWCCCCRTCHTCCRSNSASIQASSND
mmetsp:Transcript_33691/g.77740  ORF Transcript_33691/g.77740 Transcript_33691/m.77740 type:complete len:118 (+) Transcript_33691:767-1120(+)